MCGLLKRKDDLMSRDIVGIKNPRWSGGKSEYPKHGDLKRLRIILLKEAKGKCEICIKQAWGIHHIDEDKSNHKRNNLMVVCIACHRALHNYDGNRQSNIGVASVYRDEYGYSLQEMGDIIGRTGASVAYSFKFPEKKKIILQKIKEHEKQSDH